MTSKDLLRGSLNIREAVLGFPDALNEGLDIIHMNKFAVRQRLRGNFLAGFKDWSPLFLPSRQASDRNTKHQGQYLRRYPNLLCYPQP